MANGVSEVGLPLFDAVSSAKPVTPAPPASSLTPLTVTVATALRLTGLGRTKLYELIAERRVETVKVGRRRLVSVASIERLLTAGC